MLKKLLKSCYTIANNNLLKGGMRKHEKNSLKTVILYQNK